MFKYKTFEVDIVREISPEQLEWPNRGEAQTDYGLGCNREYTDLRGLSWSEARRVHDVEATLIKRIDNSTDPEFELEAMYEQLYEDDVCLFGLDIGVASTVIALSAARCVPCVSCNGGAFGDRHYETIPLVVFYARPKMASLLLVCAEEAGVGLTMAFGGTLMVFSDDIRDMRLFADRLIQSRSKFRKATKLVQRSRVTKKCASQAVQADLFRQV